MGSHLKLYKSHPDKLLEKHIEGVLAKTKKRTDSKIVELAVLFHDLGKINENFQKKLDPEYKEKNIGYSDHAYLSAYAFWCCIFSNERYFKEFLGAESFLLKLQIITAIVTKHHGNLPNMEDSFKKIDDAPNTNSIEKLLNFIDSKPYLPIDLFCNEKLKFNFNNFEIKRNEELFKVAIFKDSSKVEWQKNALSNFLETQFSFASLIEADKRDAGDKYLKEYYHFINEIEKSVSQLSDSLNLKFQTLQNETIKSDLDKFRTSIREEAVSSIKSLLQTNQRIFTLTAPTGAGKTFTLLALAAEIQKIHSELGIIYCLPFLSITEQVEGIMKDVLQLDVLSVNSKSQNTAIENIQNELDNDPSEENISRLLQQDFIQQTFDHPLIITTFVQFFETLMSNRNSTLLKLPNFSNRIFLIDEVQALPPRLYIFFMGWLEAFCEKYNSFAIISTATMPKFDFKTKKNVLDLQRPELLFKNYNPPLDLLKPQTYFEADIFNRYQINLIDDNDFTLDSLAEHISEQTESCLVILNTIKDTKELFSKIECDDNVLLINTHFTPFDRRKKIEEIKEKLKTKKIILISTQLIEAGVDVDFPIVYRDLCPLPSLIQSAGRCNRNKKQNFGQVYFFHLVDEKGKSSAEKVYRKEAKDFLDFCKKHIKDGIQEKELFGVQSKFFEFIADNLTIGHYNIEREKNNLIECVNKAEFETLGKFKLINEQEFGYEYQFYIPSNEQDNEYKKAVDLMFNMINSDTYENSKRWKIELNQQLKKIADKIITIRTFEKDSVPKITKNQKDYFGVWVLSDLSLYSYQKGFEHNSVKNTFL
ncbi:MAG: CRISPR-associated helicase Cas3' [Chitinophagales bacterium]|jgi:CRISPR-associated endonuclease/helicase Cas3|nr:CRISPR-associated helicase Cas3' [Chitinophagales bacterium]